MGTTVYGARSVLNLMRKICRLSHTPGFRPAIISIIGGTEATEFFLLFDPLCVFVEVLIASDNWFNQIDFVPDASGAEDIGPS